MTLSSKFGRLSEVIAMSRNGGLSGAVRAGVNRYRYDRSVSRTLPSTSPTTPYHVQIEPSRVCNLRCKMCEYSLMETKGNVMRLETFEKILAQFPALMSIDITGIGEPFCNPEFLDIVQHAKSRGLFVGFVNNGNLMTEERMDALIDMKVDLIQFSVDAATKATHESIRLHSDFSRVKERIALLSKKVEHAGLATPVRHMNFTMSHENVHETRPFIGLAQSLGVKEVSFRCLVVFEGGEYGEDDKIDSLGMERLVSIGDELLEEGRKMGVNVHLDPILTRESQAPRLCMRPWMDAFVDVFGNLYPCCLVTQRNEDMSQYVLGNLLTERFEDIWNGEAYQNLRADMAHPSRIPPICEGCVMLNKEPGGAMNLTRSENRGVLPADSELVQISTSSPIEENRESSLDCGN